MSLGRIAGIKIRVDASLIVIFALIVLSLGFSVLPNWHPGWGPGLTWAVAFCAALLFFVSVLLHELAHSLVGRAQGIPIRDITLFLFGGVSNMEREPPSPRAEFLMTIVGPLTSFFIGVLALIGGVALAGGDQLAMSDPGEWLATRGPVSTLLLWLGPVNILLAMFNMIPGFPLDGGRVLRSILWWLSGDLERATLWASRSGRAFGWIFIATGVAMVLGLPIPLLGSGLIGGLWMVFIGWFLRRAAIASYEMLLIEETLADLPVSRLMTPTPSTVVPNLTVAQLVDNYLMRTDQKAFPVTLEGRLLGMVCLDDVRKVPREAWGTTRVGEIMTPAGDLVTSTPDDDVRQALRDLIRRDVGQLPVVEDGLLLGLLRRSDVMRWVQLHTGAMGPQEA